MQRVAFVTDPEKIREMLASVGYAGYATDSPDAAAAA